MKKLKEAHVPYNSGWAGDLKNGQVIRIIATTTVDFVCMRRENLKERFDQARTKVYNMKLFITTGDKLMGRNNQHMMTIVENTNREGTHDLQKGMCSGYRFQLAKKEGKLRDYYHRDYKDEEIPDHGCYENLSRALAPYGIAPEDVPNPFNLNQHMKIDGVTAAWIIRRCAPNRAATWILEQRWICWSPSAPVPICRLAESRWTC